MIYLFQLTSCENIPYRNFISVTYWKFYSDLEKASNRAVELCCDMKQTKYLSLNNVIDYYIRISLNKVICNCNAICRWPYIFCYQVHALYIHKSRWKHFRLITKIFILCRQGRVLKNPKSMCTSQPKILLQRLPLQCDCFIFNSIFFKNRTFELSGGDVKLLHLPIVRTLHNIHRNMCKVSYHKDVYL